MLKKAGNEGWQLASLHKREGARNFLLAIAAIDLSFEETKRIGAEIGHG